MVVTFKDWTINDWKKHQLESPPQESLHALVSLVEGIPRTPAWISIASPDEVARQWYAIDHTRKENLPLYGVPFAVKDNIHVAGFTTTCACPAFQVEADTDAFIVLELRKAGAIIVGKTNLDQFATGLVGTRSPYGTPENAYSNKHVPGGSSSGSAVVVAQGIVPFALGTDTAGSGRVPAALNNLVGIKPSLGIWSASGVYPACKSLDTATVFAQGLADAQRVFDILTKYDDQDPYSRRFPKTPTVSFGHRPVVGVPTKLDFFGDTDNAELFDRAVATLELAGVEVRRVDCSQLFRLARLLYEGPWVAERYSAMKHMLEEPQNLDPTVYGIVSAGKKLTAVEAFEGQYLQREIAKQARRDLASVDALLMPTCPLNPTIAEVEAEPVLVNSCQGTYTNFVNLADFSAIAVPSGFRSDGLPQGVTFIGEAFNDVGLMDLASRFLKVVPGRRLGTSSKIACEDTDKVKCDEKSILLAVVGAHLSGMPLNYQLHEVGATLKVATYTAQNYRLYALNTSPPKPGIERVRKEGAEIEVELWCVPRAAFGEFMAMVPAPLAIGSLELKDGSWVKGFICENHAIENAKDITEYGGWRNYVNSNRLGKPFGSVLVANRGEIAVRIVRTLRKMGIKSVAVYSEPDRFAQHVLDADESIALGGTEACNTYLSIRKLVDACKKSGAQAIHPGYGFLSENPQFSETCAAEGITFIGPSGESIRKLGLKHTAREVARDAGVPLVPGSGLINSEEEVIAAARELSYPVMIKCSAGGGGIGLESVHKETDMPLAYAKVRRQGMSHFGNSSIFVEKLVEKSRHIEVQVFGDGYGSAISIGERDCSMQRHNQKIIEETPAPDVAKRVCEAMKHSARDLIAALRYKGAATVEFIYDCLEEKYYFLEVNARLQVEHPITECVTGLDLVEWMILIAADRAPEMNQKIECNGTSMEARLYAETPLKNFLPSAGTITQLDLPKWTRVDGWAVKGTAISLEYDPTIAKIIVHGNNRQDALSRLSAALDETFVAGVDTNLDYLRAIVRSEMFSKVQLSTKALDVFPYISKTIEIVSPGPATSIQDYPGRRGMWHLGVPPSGPMDSYAFRAANYIVGNDQRAPALEITLEGPAIVFHAETVITVTGGECSVTIDNIPIELWTSQRVWPNQKLVIGKLSSGSRAYLAIRGGIDVPEYLGSRSTFAPGKIGGHNGRNLKHGDILPLAETHIPSCTVPPPVSEPTSMPRELIPAYSNSWEICCMCGPHGAPDFFTQEAIDTFLLSDFKVHYNSNRFGVRLSGPKPSWARLDGGEAGLHPSNAHDYVYSLGAVNFTGDEPVIISCEGPSLGGFVCSVVIVDAELWKLGQVKPGDTIRFVPITVETALELSEAVSRRVTGEVVEMPVPVRCKTEPILHEEVEGNDGSPRVVYRQCGDRYMLVEFGENTLNLNIRYRVSEFSKLVSCGIPGVVELSQGVRSVNIEYDPVQIKQRDLVKFLVQVNSRIEWTKDWKVNSRIIRLPLAFEDKLTLSAVERYSDTIRREAPWLPNNVDFIREVNGLDSRREVQRMMYQAQFMVLGLGDVYLGAPCAVPLDPRHRYLGTKYNPSRSFSPNGSVGLGGMFMCIYTMDSPGGYQLVGRTIPIWDKLCLGQASSRKEPWLLRDFDLIEYYPVGEEELERLCRLAEQGKYDIKIERTEFDNAAYGAFLEANRESIRMHEERLASKMGQFAELISGSQMEDCSPRLVVDESVYDESSVLVHTGVAGRLWKTEVSVGDFVDKGTTLVILEAMKTEVVIGTPVAGKVVAILRNAGDVVDTGDLLVVVEPEVCNE